MIDLFITSTEPEARSITDDDTPYKFTTREVKLTGMPRHDRLIIKRREAVSGGQANRILIAPTWRDSLFTEKINGSTEARGVKNGFDKSQFMNEWRSLLFSDDLKEIAKTHNARITFLPHPMLQSVLNPTDFPSHVEWASYADADIQQLLAESCVMITDYSSIVMDGAVAGSPVVYFQFDKEAIFSGGHIFTPGYFSYENSGYGPVVDSVHDVLVTVAALAQEKWRRPHLYESRANADFTCADGQASARVFAEIRALDAPERIV